MHSPDLRILASHPVQYQAPLFRELHESGLFLEVGYLHPGSSLWMNRDVEFNLDIKWDIDLLDGYPSLFFNQATCRLTLSKRIQSGQAILSWALKERNIPLLLVGWSSMIILLVWYARILSRAPILVSGDNTLGSFYYSKKPTWKVILLKWLLRHTDAVLYFGQKNKEFFLSMGVNPEKLFFTPHSVDNDRFYREWKHLIPDRRSLCLEHGLDPSKPTFLYCGKLIQKKRPLLLLDAYLSAGLMNDAQLIYVGEGALRSELEERITNYNLRNVHLLGFFNQTRMPLAYVLGEVLCLISDPTETWGLVVNEAQACSRPVIASGVIGCVPDLIFSSNGWVVPFDNFEQLTNTLQLAISMREKWGEMGVTGRKRVMTNSFNRMAEGLRASVDSMSVGT